MYVPAPATGTSSVATPASPLACPMTLPAASSSTRRTGTATLDAKPSLAEPLNKLAPLLTNDVMQNLNLQVDGPLKREPADVARDFLKQNGLA